MTTTKCRGKTALVRMVIVTLTWASLLVAAAPLVAADAKPNVLFILADDFRQDCVASWGNPHL